MSAFSMRSGRARPIRRLTIVANRLGRRDRHEHETEADREADEHQIGRAAERRRGDRRDADEQDAGRYEEPFRFAEVGELVEHVHQPGRNAAMPGNGPGIEEQHRRRDGDDRNAGADGQPADRRQKPHGSTGARGRHQRRSQATRWANVRRRPVRAARPAATGRQRSWRHSRTVDGDGDRTTAADVDPLDPRPAAHSAGRWPRRAARRRAAGATRRGRSGNSPRAARRPRLPHRSAGSMCRPERRGSARDSRLTPRSGSRNRIAGEHARQRHAGKQRPQATGR